MGSRRGSVSAAVLGLLLASACASSSPRRTVITPTPEAQKAEEDRCRSDPDPDCVETLTAGDARESEAEVAAAERAREADAFKARLRKLRRDHEARQAEKIRSSTRAPARVDIPALVPPGPDLEDTLQEELERLADRDEHSDSGSSVRAVVADAPGPRAPAAAPRPVPAAPLGRPPTPEALLRGALCVLEVERAAIRDGLKAVEARPGATRAARGAWALAQLDVERLAARIRAEIAHRRLAKPGPVCSSSALKPARVDLRRVVGESPESSVDLDAWAGRLAKLARALEIRAGLPRAE